MPIATLATLEETDAYRKKAQFWLDKQGGMLFDDPRFVAGPNVVRNFLARAAIGEFLANQDGKTLCQAFAGTELPPLPENGDTNKCPSP